MLKKYKIITITLVSLISCAVFFSYCASIAWHTPLQQTTSKPNRALYEKDGSIVWDMPTEKKVIALTFDDGPNSEFTPGVLELLKKYNAKATFFLVGSCVEAFPKLAQQIKAEGHEIGNHTFTHPDLRRISLSTLKTEIEKTSSAIYKATGSQTKYFRPSGGLYNAGIVNIAKESKLTIILWSWDQDTLDWTKPNKDKIYAKIIKNASGGDVILMHDSQIQTVKALEKVLPKLQEMGYSFITISELLKYKK